MAGDECLSKGRFMERDPTPGGYLANLGIASINDSAATESLFAAVFSKFVENLTRTVFDLG